MKYQKKILRKKIYYANFCANNNTRFFTNINDTNKWRLLKDIREIARGERFAGNTSTFFVNDVNGEEVFSGIINNNGVLTYETYNYIKK